MTRKQKAFCDFYIETGNAAEAARKAGYSEKTAKEIGQQNLTKLDLKDYIARRMAEIDAERVASADEVVKFFSAVMRGEIKDQFGLDASLMDRINAGRELMKRYSAGGYSPGKTKSEDDPLTAALKEEARRLQNGDIT